MKFNSITNFPSPLNVPLFALFQRSSISPAEREKYSRPRSPDPQHHDHLPLKKMKKEQDKDIGHVGI